MPVQKLGLAAIAALALLTSCFSLRAMRFEAQEVHFRHDEAKDELEILLIYEGIEPVDDTDEARALAVRAIHAILEKQRYFILGDWPFEFDLDHALGLDELLAFSERDPDASPQAKEWFELLDSLQVTFATATRKGAGEVIVAQQLRLPRVSSAFALLNRYLRKSVLDNGAWDDRKDAGDVFDAATWARMVERAKRGDDFITFARGRLEIQLESSKTTAAKWISCMAKDHDGAGSSVTRGLLEALSELDVADGRLCLTFLPDSFGCWCFRFGVPAGDAHPEEQIGIAERAKRAGVELDKGPGLNRMRGLLRR